MLPLVGVVAIGFLVVAGKLFFFSTSEEKSSPLPILQPLLPQPDPVPQGGNTSETNDAPIFIANEEPAIKEPAVEELVVENSSTVANAIPVPIPSSSDGQERRSDPFGGALDIRDVPSEDEPENNNVVVVVPPRPRPAPVPAPAPIRNSQTQNRTPTPPTPAPPAPTPNPEPAKPSWMVQVGAFSTQAAADAFSQQVTKAGYKATVVSSRTLHRVLVQGEDSREATLALATRMSQNGFRGAFIVTPRQ
jgi:cell division protein FtsN